MLSPKNKGFTLIELLVVIAIIGLLASIVLVSVNSSREKARVAKSKTELKQFYTALEMYYDNYNTFPCFNEGSVSGCLLGAISVYGAFPVKDPWGSDYHWHNPGCCIDECAMIISAGPNKTFCADGSYNCEHVMSQTANCVAPNTAYDDVGIYFGQVRSHQ